MKRRIARSPHPGDAPAASQDTGKHKQRAKNDGLFSALQKPAKKGPIDFLQ